MIMTLFEKILLPIQKKVSKVKVFDKKLKNLL